MTVSDAFAPAEVLGMPGGNANGATEKARVGPGPRARVPATERDGKISRLRVLAAVVWSDIRAAWWTPASLPTVRQAWVQRWPDRTLVPGDNGLLYGLWAGYNHAVALPLITTITGLVGALGVAAWLIFHPGRFGLAVLIGAPVVALIG